MYADRRHKLLDQLNGSVAIFCAPTEAIRNDDVHHDFRQDSDLYYLTGFEEPESVLVLSAKDGETPKSILFLRARDPDREIWDGPRLGIESAIDTLGIDEAHPIESLKEALPTILTGAKTVFYDLARLDREENDAIVLNAFTQAKRKRRRDGIAPSAIQDSGPLVHEMRLFKSAEEIAIMREAAQLTAQGHIRAMEVTAPGVCEYQVQSAMEFEWLVRGAERNAYPSIVGSGPNACILHYRAGPRVMNDGDLVLVDAGSEKSFYASDVTRTWPVNGTFSEPQKAIYSIVLDAQKKCIDSCRPGQTIDGVHDVAVAVLVDGLIELGLLEGPAEKAIEDESYKRFYMHRTSHWIGMDVHDVGAYSIDGSPRPMQAGMVLTVEPGIYISPADTSVPERYRGIGIRIEDDIVVTNGAPDILTSATPKEIADIEAVVGTKLLDL